MLSACHTHTRYSLTTLTAEYLARREQGDGFIVLYHTKDKTKNKRRKKEQKKKKKRAILHPRASARQPALRRRPTTRTQSKSKSTQRAARSARARITPPCERKSQGAFLLFFCLSAPLHKRLKIPLWHDDRQSLILTLLSHSVSRSRLIKA